MGCLLMQSQLMETGFILLLSIPFLVGQIFYKILTAANAFQRVLIRPNFPVILSFSENVHTCNKHYCLQQPVARAGEQRDWQLDSPPAPPIFFPLGLSLSLAPSRSRLSIRNNNNRWEPPPGSAWECSGIIAAGTPSTITQCRASQAGKLQRPGSHGTQAWARERKGESLLMHHWEPIQKTVI